MTFVYAETHKYVEVTSFDWQHEHSCKTHWKHGTRQPQNLF